MSALTHLASYGVSIQQAYEFIVSNLSNPRTIFDVSKAFGITNNMLGEIISTYMPGVSGAVVKNFFASNGIDSSSLDSTNSPSPSLPTSYTSTSGTTYQIVVGTSGNDSFTHTSGNAIYFGMGGNDTFSNTTFTTGRAIFVGGTGNDTYNTHEQGLISIKDVGGGFDTLNTYAWDAPYGVNYTIDNRYFEADFYNTSSSSIPYAGIILGDLTNPNDTIEAINLPGYLTYSLSQSQALSAYQRLDNWLGNYSSAALGVTSTYQVIADIVGIYDQYVAAGY